MTRARRATVAAIVGAMALALVAVLAFGRGQQAAVEVDAVAEDVTEDPEEVAEPADAVDGEGDAGWEFAEPPELRTSSDDFEEVITSILEYYDYLFENPQPELVGQIYSGGCDCYEVLVEKLEALRAEGRRFGQSTTRAVSVEVSEVDEEEGLAWVYVQKELGPRSLIDNSTGEVLDADDGAGVERLDRYVLLRERGRWVVRLLNEVEE